MKNLFKILLLCVGVLFATNSYALISTASNPNETETQDAKIGINDLKTLSVKEIEAKIGHDLTWKQKLAIKVLKNKAQKAEEHPDKPAIEGSSFLGFLLGFVLSLIGVLITYIVFSGEKKTIRGAWIGFLLGILLYVLIL